MSFDVSSIFGGTGLRGLAIALAVLMGWIVSVCLHEFGHAIVAYWGGDTTVKAKGYLTLNPLKYTDIGNSLVLPIVFLMLGGIALPGAAVYINTPLLRSRAWRSAVSAAGPLATLLVAIGLAVPFRLGLAGTASGLGSALALLASFQVAGLCFNLCPIPSMDGFGILEPWLPAALQQQANRWGRYGYLVFLGVLWTVPAANQGFWGLVGSINHLLGIPAHQVMAGYGAFVQSSKVLFVVMLIGLLLLRKRWGPALNQPEASTEKDLGQEP